MYNSQRCPLCGSISGGGGQPYTYGQRPYQPATLPRQYMPIETNWTRLLPQNITNDLLKQRRRKRPLQQTAYGPGQPGYQPQRAAVMPPRPTWNREITAGLETPPVSYGRIPRPWSEITAPEQAAFGRRPNWMPSRPNWMPSRPNWMPSRPNWMPQEYW